MTVGHCAEHQARNVGWPAKSCWAGLRDMLTGLAKPGDEFGVNEEGSFRNTFSRFQDCHMPGP